MCIFWRLLVFYGVVLVEGISNTCGAKFSISLQHAQSYDTTVSPHTQATRDTLRGQKTARHVGQAAVLSSHPSGRNGSCTAANQRPRQSRHQKGRHRHRVQALWLHRRSILTSAGCVMHPTQVTGSRCRQCVHPCNMRCDATQGGMMVCGWRKGGGGGGGGEGCDKHLIGRGRP